MKLTFLGTGTSFGVPVVGCTCDVCTSDDPRDHRTRHGAIVEWQGFRLLIDTPPELRQQLLANEVDHINGVWYTHMHADHVHGIDDLRVFSLRSQEHVVAFIPEQLVPEFRGRFPYIFDPAVQAPAGTSKPLVEIRPVRAGVKQEIGGRTVVPLPVPHGGSTVFGLRVGNLGYVTDAKSLPDDVFDSLRGVDVLVLNALWWGDPHPTHMNVEEAVQVAQRIGARRTLLTHLTHRLQHKALAAALEAGIEPAFDGLSLEIRS